jgi:hypothetical protein
MNDSERMDWLERNRLIASIIWRYVEGTFTLRMAVDFAATLNIVSGIAMRDEWRRACGITDQDIAETMPPKYPVER